MKIKDIEKIYTLFEKVPKSFSISIQEKLLRNRSIVSKEFEIFSKLKSNLYTDDYVKFSQEYTNSENKSEIINKFSETINVQKMRTEEFEKYLNKEFSEELVYINIEELPDDISILDSEVLETILLVTKE